MVGRKEEQRELLELFDRNQADLVAIYGRRRVGKTFLVDSTFDNHYLFRHAGRSWEDKENRLTKTQLGHFRKSLLLYGAEDMGELKDWSEAFFHLEKLILAKDNGEKQVIFIDELPWLDTDGSHFISEFEGFWNSFACGRKNLTLVVCGSATSWMQNNLINSHGGLYGRPTREIRLRPFTLKECKEFFQAKNANFSDYDIMQAYMAVGGIPYYLDYFRPEKSMVQNINDLFFEPGSPLNTEYGRLFNSMFDYAEASKRIVEFLSTKKLGYTREEIIGATKLPNNGYASSLLKSLVAADFAIEYIPFAPKRKTTLYKLADPFCLFYAHFILGKKAGKDFWINNYLSQNVASWRGIAFENACFNHIDQIKDALGIRAVGTEASTWYCEEDGEKSQIDLLIKRNDNIINVCELKFYSEDYAVTKGDYQKILSRTERFCKYIPKKYGVQNTLITTYGLKKNMYSSAFLSVVTLDDLFKF